MFNVVAQIYYNLIFKRELPVEYYDNSNQNRMNM